MSDNRDDDPNFLVCAVLVKCPVVKIWQLLFFAGAQISILQQEKQDERMEGMTSKIISQSPVG